MGGVNQLERDLIRMRQRERIDLAKKEGKDRGRVKKYYLGDYAVTESARIKFCDVNGIGN